MGTLADKEEFFYNLSKADLYDLFGLVVGDPLGSGCYRKVFVWGKEYVVKYERTAGAFSNAAEMRLWRDVRDGKLAKFFAPCLSISPNGQWLIQARTKPCTLAQLKRAHKRVPAIFTDLKPANWGWFKGKLVCHDYGNQNVERSIHGTRAATWWEESTTSSS